VAAAKANSVRGAGVAAIAGAEIGNDNAIADITIRISWCRMFIVVLRHFACGERVS
jgi:hypothetical protein